MLERRQLTRYVVQMCDLRAAENLRSIWLTMVETYMMSAKMRSRSCVFFLWLVHTVQEYHEYENYFT